jgi:hypothetical protein
VVFTSNFVQIIFGSKEYTQSNNQDVTIFRKIHLVILKQTDRQTRKNDT